MISYHDITDAIVVPQKYLGFHQIAFACAALSKDETRYILNLLQVTKDGLITRVVATDGRRLHIADIDPGLFEDDISTLDPGLYHLISKSSKQLVLQKANEKLESYPNWKAVLAPFELGDQLSEFATIADSGKIGEVMIRTGLLLDTGFLATALGYGASRKASESVSISFDTQDDETGPVIINHDHGTALVMPLKRNDGESLEDEEEDGPVTAPFEGLIDAMDEGDSIEVNGKEVFKKGADKS